VRYLLLGAIGTTVGFGTARKRNNEAIMVSSKDIFKIHKHISRAKIETQLMGYDLKGELDILENGIIKHKYKL
jgi:hypothetical protein